MGNDCQSEHLARERRLSRLRRAIGALVIGLLFVGASACLKYSKPNLPRIYTAADVPRQTGKRPIIVIPGILGSQFVNRRTGEVVWPGLRRSKNDPLALPIGAATLADNRDELAATEIVTSAQLNRFLPEIGVYNSLLHTLEDYGGYKHGDFNHPAADGDRDTFYIFAYDWRRDNVESAQLLIQKLERLKATLNRPDLRFDVIAHSMGGLVARYAAMYGERDVLSVSGEPRPNWAGARHFARLMLFGTPNLGSMDALSALLLGYSVLESELPTMKELRRVHKDLFNVLSPDYRRAMTPAQLLFLAPEKPEEELYDLAADPHEINNLARDPKRRATLARMRAAVEKWMKETNDLGLVPETELIERMRPGGVWATTAKPVLSLKGGAFDSPVTVKVSCPTPGASIVYTAEEGERARWKLYGDGIWLTSSARLRVKACRYGYKDSEEAVALYEIGKPAVSR